MEPITLKSLVIDTLSAAMSAAMVIGIVAML